MRYLIDTQILIWSIITPEKLSSLVANILQSNEIFVSQIAFFEIAIKQKIGKLEEFNLSIESLHYRVEQDGFYVLPLKIDHIAAYRAIPLNLIPRQLANFVQSVERRVSLRFLQGQQMFLEDRVVQVEPDLGFTIRHGQGA